LKLHINHPGGGGGGMQLIERAKQDSQKTRRLEK